MIRLIRLAWNGAAVISDLSVLCGDSSALRSGRPSFSLSTLLKRDRQRWRCRPHSVV
ncbi:hypothetical protein HMPREF9535_03646 [Escherichia coli MS 78-1]|nr:hypothetical protein HMPREF9535_03646 [Escherichia coli MS 78-1]